MLIRTERERWINIDLGNVRAIEIRETWKRDELHIVIDFELIDGSEQSRKFSTFEEAEAFVRKIVNQLNAEASHDNRQLD